LVEVTKPALDSIPGQTVGEREKIMQVTLTLNHFIIMFFCGILVIIIVYALQIYKNINEELSAITARITRFQERISRAAEKMQQSAADFQCISEEFTGKRASCRKKNDRCAIGISESIADFKEALTILRHGGMLKKKKRFFKF